MDSNTIYILIVILICLIPLAYYYDTKIKSKKAVTSDYKTISTNETNLPYTKKYLLTKTEYNFYKILRSICDNYKIQICPKVRLEDLAEVTTKSSYKDTMKYRGYIKSRHIDFILCDNYLNILAAIELDDYSHNTYKSNKIDNFKNNFFRTINIRLERIKVGTDYQSQINNIILSLGITTDIHQNKNEEQIIIQNQTIIKQNYEILEHLKKLDNISLNQGVQGSNP